MIYVHKIFKIHLEKNTKNSNGEKKMAKSNYVPELGNTKRLSADCRCNFSRERYPGCLQPWIAMNMLDAWGDEAVTPAGVADGGVVNPNGNFRHIEDFSNEEAIFSGNPEEPFEENLDPYSCVLSRRESARLHPACKGKKKPNYFGPNVRTVTFNDLDEDQRRKLMWLYQKEARRIDRLKKYSLAKAA